MFATISARYFNCNLLILDFSLVVLLFFLVQFISGIYINVTDCISVSHPKTVGPDWCFRLPHHSRSVLQFCCQNKLNHCEPWPHVHCMSEVCVLCSVWSSEVWHLIYRDRDSWPRPLVTFWETCFGQHEKTPVLLLLNLK